MAKDDSKIVPERHNAGGGGMSPTAKALITMLSIGGTAFFTNRNTGLPTILNRPPGEGQSDKDAIVNILKTDKEAWTRWKGIEAFMEEAYGLSQDEKETEAREVLSERVKNSRKPGSPERSGPR